jgi:hypothetical protein
MFNKRLIGSLGTAKPFVLPGDTLVEKVLCRLATRLLTVLYRAYQWAIGGHP